MDLIERIDCKKRPLVSVITACYNEEKYIGQLLDSVLAQTYPCIEMICVDDGSTDETARIIQSYISRFQEGGKILQYHYQENRGQAAATNYGLKLVTGEYLCWIDGDDRMSEVCVEKKVEFLETHREFGIVTSDFYMWYENRIPTLERRAKIYGKINLQKHQFYPALIGECIIENLAHMIRMENLKEVNPKLEIAECREGQNYQLLLPVLYHCKRGFIDEPLAYYRIHDDSHCHRKRTQEEQKERYDTLLLMLEEILLGLKIPEEEVLRYIKMSTFYKEKERFLEYGRIV